MNYYRLLVELLSKYSNTTECLHKKGELVSRPIRSINYRILILNSKNSSLYLPK
ncbi:hypothetical protein LFU01_22500 [Lysinibacillus fusiformis]|nr:hypothetical protein LFU01_22500 [Lysinibacillus fusiformis]